MPVIVIVSSGFFHLESAAGMVDRLRKLAQGN
jgi:hypothetical protein